MEERTQPIERPSPRGCLAAALVLALLVAPACARRPARVTAIVAPAPPAADPQAAARARAGGWGWLVDKLVADGVPEDRVVAVFGNPQLPAFDGLGFSIAPREPRSRYRQFLTADSVALARRCRDRHAAALDAAAAAHQVPASVVAAILHVESGCGRNTGRSPILYRLARLAMANEPANVAWNVRRHDGERDPAIAEQVRARARYLEDTFYPEVRALFVIEQRNGIHPLAMRGSEAGAFGYPQFLPTSYLRFGVDANGDGTVSLYDFDDAVASCASYLAGWGWRPGLTQEQQEAVIWRYNRSDAYVETILRLADRIQEGEPEVQTAGSMPDEAEPEPPEPPASAPAPAAHQGG